VVRRALTWGLTLPLVGASVLAGHALAYAATGSDPGAMHAYLAHAPQVLAVLVLVGLVGLAVDQRSGRPATAPFALLGMVVFALQEHLERYAHAGEVPLLLADRTFLLGLALQVPVGLVALWVARRLVAVLREVGRTPSRPPRIGEIPFVLPVAAVGVGGVRLPVVGLGRGPPALLRP